MAYSARILLDSVAPCRKRLTTFEITYPRFVHSEFMTHRLFSRNSASSRAIPISKMIERVENDPAMPVYWGKNQKGMQAEEELSQADRLQAEAQWLLARDKAVEQANLLNDLGLHKQIVNRVLEPWMWITVICTATEFGNFFNLRCHPDAQPEIKKIAEMMADEYYNSTPYPLPGGRWHMPLLQADDPAEIRKLFDTKQFPIPEGPDPIGEILKQISVARCARVSYLTHEGKRDILKDLELCERLKGGSGGIGHWSPFEHVAQAMDLPTQSGNFWGWKQYRKEFENECHSEYKYPR